MKKCKETDTQAPPKHFNFNCLILTIGAALGKDEVEKDKRQGYITTPWEPNST